MLRVTNRIAVPAREIEINAVRSQGAGGQNVNKVASAVHLRFDISASSLPGPVKERMKQLGDQRITSQGVVVIKAQQHRSQEKNREEALSRLGELIGRAAFVPRKRKPTTPTGGSRLRRLEGKAIRARIKRLRTKVTGPED